MESYRTLDLTASREFYAEQSIRDACTQHYNDNDNVYNDDIMLCNINRPTVNIIYRMQSASCLVKKVMASKYRLLQFSVTQLQISDE